MKTKRQYKSEAMESIYSSVKALFDIGAIDKANMEHFDKSCSHDITDHFADVGKTIPKIERRLNSVVSKIFY